MPLTLRAMDSDRLPTWLEHCTEQYIDELLASGRTREDAIRNAANGIGRSFPGGVPAPGHAVFDLIDDAGDTVGYLWIGPDTSDDAAAWWVWDIEVSADRRGHGYGRAAMELGEEYARNQGARTLGLNVFGSNAVARRLYESLGYETTAVQMRKVLTPAQSPSSR